MNPLNASRADSQGIVYSLDSSTRTATITSYPVNTTFDSLRNSVRIVYHMATGGVIDTYGGHTGPAYVINLDGAGQANRNWEFDDFGRLIVRNNTAKCLYRDCQMVDWSSLSTNDLYQYWYIEDGEYIRNRGNGYYLGASGFGVPAGNTYLTSTRNNNCRWSFALSGDSSYNSFVTPSSNNTKPTNLPNQKLTIKRGVMDTNGVIYKVKYINGSVFPNYICSITFPHHRSSEITITGTINSTISRIYKS